MKIFTRYVLKRDYFLSYPGRSKYFLEKYKFGFKTDESLLFDKYQAMLAVRELWRNGYKVKLDWNVFDLEICNMFYNHERKSHLPEIKVGKIPPPPIRGSQIRKD